MSRQLREAIKKILLEGSSTRAQDLIDEIDNDLDDIDSDFYSKLKYRIGTCSDKLEKVSKKLHELEDLVDSEEEEDKYEELEDRYFSLNRKLRYGEYEVEDEKYEDPYYSRGLKMSDFY